MLPIFRDRAVSAGLEVWHCKVACRLANEAESKAYAVAKAATEARQRAYLDLNAALAAAERE